MVDKNWCFKVFVVITFVKFFFFTGGGGTDEYGVLLFGIFLGPLFDDDTEVILLLPP